MHRNQSKHVFVPRPGFTCKSARFAYSLIPWLKLKSVPASTIKINTTMSDAEAAPMVDFAGVGINSVDTLIRLPRFPAFDSKVEVISSEILPGGQVATPTVACQRWG